MIAINRNPLAILSDSELIKRLDALVQKEREATLEILQHLGEMDCRRLYLAMGYGSLFEYCTRCLGYSESAANRRIKTARCIRDHQEIYELLSCNELNLSSASKLSVIITEQNKQELLEEVRCKSARQVDEIIARFRPMNALHDRMRAVYVKKSPHDSTQKQGMSAYKSDKFRAADVGGRTFTTCTGRQQQATALEKKYKLEFAIEPECMKKLEEAKALLSKKYPKKVPLGKLLEEALDAYLDKNSPERKKKRRETRRAKKQDNNNDKPSQKKMIQKSKAKNSSTKTIEAERSTNRGPTHSKHEGNHIISRHIPQAIQDEVYARDGGRCTFIGPDGMRCNSTWNLQIDHIMPFAKGGSHNIQNLRLLCAKHNNLEAANIYGKEFMAEKKSKAIPMRK